MPVHKAGYLKKIGESDSECSSSMFRSSENKEFTFVIDCFQNKKKDEVGHSGQTLNLSFYASTANQLKNYVKTGLYIFGIDFGLAYERSHLAHVY